MKAAVSHSLMSKPHVLFTVQYNDLMKKKRIVENDKAKILQTIKELDQKKNEALNLAWQKVSPLSDNHLHPVVLHKTNVTTCIKYNLI